MNNWCWFVELLNFNSSMHFWSSGSTNQQWDFQSSFLKLFGIEDHFIKRWSDKSWKTNNISFFSKTGINDWLNTAHDSHVDDSVIVASKNNTHNVFTNIMDISLDSS